MRANIQTEMNKLIATVMFTLLTINLSASPGLGDTEGTSINNGASFILWLIFVAFAVFMLKDRADF